MRIELSALRRQATRAENLATCWETPPQGLRAAAVERAPTFIEDREFLKGLFPRGRLKVSEDGRPVLVPRDKSLAGWHLFRDGPGVGVYWVGSWPKLERAVQGIRRRREEIRCGDEGFLYLGADPRLAERLPWFSRAKVTEATLQNLQKAALTRGKAGFWSGSTTPAVPRDHSHPETELPDVGDQGIA